MTTPSEPAPSYGHRWLLALPFVWQVAAVPLVNGIELRILGLPFPMIWQLLGIVLTTIVIAIVFHLDEAAEAGLSTDSSNDA